jgi:hypothetical protein
MWMLSKPLLKRQCLQLAADSIGQRNTSQVFRGR